MPSRPEIVASISEAEAAIGILTTGSSPTSLRDLLVVGSQERNNYLSGLRASLANKAIHSYLCDDAIVVPDPRMGIAYYEQSAFVKALDNLAQGKEVDPIVKPWSTGPWLPEAFAEDLRRALPVHNATNLFDSARAFDAYPPLLQEAICEKTMLEILSKSERIDASGENLGNSMLATDICFAGLRYLHAENATYFRGLHYAEETIPHLPNASQALAAKLIASPNNYTSTFVIIR